MMRQHVRVPQVVKVRQHVRSLPLAKVKQQLFIKTEKEKEITKWGKSVRYQHRPFVRVRVRNDEIPIAVIPILGGVSFQTPLGYINLTRSSNISEYGHIEVGKRGNVTKEEPDCFECDGYFSLVNEDSFSVHDFLKTSKLLAKYHEYIANFITLSGVISLKRVLQIYSKVVKGFSLEEVNKLVYKGVCEKEKEEKEEEEPEPECPICFGKSAVCSSTSCSHVFCQKCIQNWAAACATANTCCTCPMCCVEIKTVVLKL